MPTFSPGHGYPLISETATVLGNARAFNDENPLKTLHTQVWTVPWEIISLSREQGVCFQRAMNRCGEKYMSFAIRACGIRRLLRNHLLPGLSLGQLQAVIFKFWVLLWIRKEGELKVERNWFSV